VIYAERCAPCHGDLGLGDGPQSSDLPVPVPALGDEALAAAARPVDWYNMVTNGNMERFMPPFKSLDDRQRWDVVAYALSLSLPQEEIAAGEEVYAANCLSCHGAQGEGGQSAPNWLNESGRLAQLSLNEIATVTGNGVGEMPGFTSSLSEAEIRSVAVYVRSLSFAQGSELVQTTPVPTVESDEGASDLTSVPAETAENFPPPDQPDNQATATAEASQRPTTITVVGELVAADGVNIPEDLTVTLAGFDGMDQAFEAQTTVNTDGSFIFKDVEFVAGRAYLAAIDFNGLTYTSDVYHSPEQPPEDGIDLPITFYDTTSDLAALRADRLHVFFDFSRSGVVQVVELFILNNTGDKAIVPASAGEGVVQYELPAGAANLQFEDGVLGERYLPTEKGFADTASIPPGQGMQLLFAYDLPYERKAQIAIPIPYPVDAAVVMLPAGSIKLSSDQLQSTGVRDVQGVSLEMFTASNLAGGSTLDITLSGRVSTAAGVATGNSTGLVIGGSVLGLVLVAGGFWLWRQRKPLEVEEAFEEPPAEETAEEIMDAIIALDDQYQSGNLPEEAYQARRAELKARLQAKMS
jgi:mono/diheme cytochrome c family protein